MPVPAQLANLVLFGQETAELQMHIKSYFVLHVKGASNYNPMAFMNKIMCLYMKAVKPISPPDEAFIFC